MNIDNEIDKSLENTKSGKAAEYVHHINNNSENPSVFSNSSSNSASEKKVNKIPDAGEPQRKSKSANTPYQQNSAPVQPPYYQQGWGMPPQYDQYGQPVYYPYYGYQNVPAQPKKKLRTGIKVFLWILLGLSVFSIVGYGVYTVNDIAKGLSNNSNYGYGYGYDNNDNYDSDNGDDNDSDYSDNYTYNPPDIDVIPNEDGIHIQSKEGKEELSAEQIYSKVSVSTVTVQATLIGSLDDEENENVSTGTGIIATSDGYIITNSHVILNSKLASVRIITYDEQTYEAVVIGFDRTTDLAVLKTNDHGFTPAEFGNADELGIGEWVIAIGNPGGVRFSSSLTRGVVSGLNRTVGSYSDNGMTFIQTDAAINPGNSGGPLVNMYGQVVGINSSKIVASGYEGMGFAIPVSKAESIINQILSIGYVEGRVRLGIKGRDVAYGEYYSNGFRIEEIDEDSSFKGTQAQENDIITAIDGIEVTGLNDISNILLSYKPGDEVVVTLYRPSGVSGGEEIEVVITLLEDKGETQG